MLPVQQCDFMNEVTCKDFYSYLRQQFSNIDDAKIFVSQWARGTHKDSSGEQELTTPKLGKFGECTYRAMAYHVSMVLEGHDDDPRKDDEWPNYMSTKHGTDLYFSM